MGHQTAELVPGELFVDNHHESSTESILRNFQASCLRQTSHAERQVFLSHLRANTLLEQVEK